MQKKLPFLLSVLSYLLIIIVSIKSLREPDLWWQIRTGEWIWLHKHVPTQDVFSFTNTGVDWINIKWGFEVMYALISKLFAPESIFILQIFFSIILLYFFQKIIKLFKINSTSVFFIATILLIFGIEYRIIGRPEMYSHAMTLIYLYILTFYYFSKSKSIYFIIPLQILWCNMHEAYGIGIVMLLIFTFSSWIEYFLNKVKKPIEISFITIISILSIVINPRGILLITRPLNIFSQVQKNKYTTELDNILSENYWHKESYFFTILAIFFIYFLYKNLKIFFTKNTNITFPIFYLLTCLAFLFLAFTAYRNILFFILVSMPIVAHEINKLAPSIEKYKVVLLLTGILFYILIVSNKYYALTNSRDRYGMELMSINNPVGAANFIEEKQLQNKKCFSDYLTSSYLLWKLQPNFKTFIDLRDLDIFSVDFFDKYLKIINNPNEFQMLDKTEHFEYAVLYRASNEALHQYLYNDSIYACTYVDAVAAVYQKTDDIPKGDIFAMPTKVPTHTLAMSVNKIFNPFYSSFDYDQVNIDFEAAQFYTIVGKISLAEKRINNYLYVNPTNEHAIALKNRILNLKNNIK